MSTSAQARRDRLMPRGIPRYVRCYYDSKTSDGYTVVFTGRWPFTPTPGQRRRHCIGLCMSGAPFHPQGAAYHIEHPQAIDRPRSKHLGCRIGFEKLPKDCQRLVIRDYCNIWGIDQPETADAGAGHS